MCDKVVTNKVKAAKPRAKGSLSYQLHWCKFSNDAACLFIRQHNFEPLQSSNSK